MKETPFVGGREGWITVGLAILMLVLTGCANPYALNINKLNFGAKQKGWRHSVL